MSTYIPGQSVGHQRYMTGRKPVQAANYVENQGPKDGTVIGISINGSPRRPGARLAEGLKADLAR